MEGVEHYDRNAAEAEQSAAQALNPDHARQWRQIAAQWRALAARARRKQNRG